MSIRNALAALGAACLLIASPSGIGGMARAEAEAKAQVKAKTHAVTLTLPQAHAMARAAIQQGRPQLAYAMSETLLAQDPRNGHGHFIRAMALASVKEFGEARKSARRAFRFSDTDLHRHEAANLAAQLAYADDRFTLSQLWLRRAVHYAGDEVTRERSIDAYRKVRVRNPLNFHLSFSLTPSDNVNNGSNSPYNLIDGVPAVGVLSPSAQAISGVVARLDFSASYRLAQGEGYETRLRGRAYSRQVSLNDPVPGISGSDLGSTSVELGVSHFLANRAAPGSYWRLDATAGRVWYGGDPLYNSYALGVTRHQKLGENLSLTLSGSVERQIDQVAPLANATVTELSAGLSYGLSGGATLGGHLQYRDTENRIANRNFDNWAGVVSFKPARPVGPAELLFTLGYGESSYDRYFVVGFPVPGGRQDSSVFGGVTATFKDWSYMGFVPTVSVKSQKSRSNVSRFEVEETSLSVGIRSEF